MIVLFCVTHNGGWSDHDPNNNIKSVGGLVGSRGGLKTNVRSGFDRVSAGRFEFFRRRRNMECGEIVMRYFSLFSGIGGFELGIPESWKCIGYSEMDKYAIQIYEGHFDHENFGDATKIKAEKLPNFDFLVGGFPCQAFSIVGRRRGFDDVRGTLFFDIARVLKEKQPKYFLLENVKGLLSHDNGRTFKIIVTTLVELRYDLQWQVLNSKNFGVPQNRERIFIVGHYGGKSRPQIFPLLESATKALEQIISGPQSESVFSAQGLSKSLLAGGGGLGAKTGLHYFAVKGDLFSRNNPRRQNGFDETTMFTLRSAITHGVGYSEDSSIPAPSVRTIRGGGRGSPPESKQNWDSYLINGKIRRLTPVECERLQGFPDDWTKGVSDGQRYKCLGNAVTVNVVRAIMKRFISL